MNLTEYAVIGAGAILLLVIALVWMRRSRGRDTDDDIPMVREEPTLVPQEKDSAEPAEGEPPEAAAASEPVEALEPEPQQPDPAPTTEPLTAAESESEPEARSDPQPEAESQPEAEPKRASAPELEPDPAFVSARSKLDEELQAGHFSRLDVFEEYQRASEKAYGHIGPRSEYFSRVVNEAIAVRDAFEALLDEEDRGRFVEGHSRYLDDVSVEADEAARVRMHREQIELLHQLRPRAAAEHAEA